MLHSSSDRWPNLGCKLLGLGDSKFNDNCMPIWFIFWVRIPQKESHGFEEKNPVPYLFVFSRILKLGCSVGPKSGDFAGAYVYVAWTNSMFLLSYQLQRTIIISIQDPQLTFSLLSDYPFYRKPWASIQVRTIPLGGKSSLHWKVHYFVHFSLDLPGLCFQLNLSFNLWYNKVIYLIL